MNAAVEFVERDIRERSHNRNSNSEEMQVITDISKIPPPEIKTSRYEILGEIKRGYWGVVFKAKDMYNQGEYCALKIPYPTDVARKQMEYRVKNLESIFQNEARRSNSRYLVQMRIQYDDSIPPKPFIDMNYFPYDLRKKYEKYRRDLSIYGRNTVKGYSVDNSENAIMDIANGLSEIHSRRTYHNPDISNIHGDLKFENILVNYNGGCFIGDLGASTIESEHHSGPRDNIGDYIYMAPERANVGSLPSKEADIWSFGAIAYELFSGMKLKEDVDKLDDKNIKKKIRKNVPRAYRKVLEDCLKINPKDRISHGQDLIDRLEKSKENHDFNKVFKKGIDRYVLPAVGASILIATTWYMNAYHDYVKLEIPNISVEGGVVGLEHNMNKEPVLFDFEELKLKPVSVIPFNSLTDYEVKTVSNNPNVRVLYKNYHEAYGINAIRRGLLISNEQIQKRFSTYNRMNGIDLSSYTRGDILMNMAAKSIEIALSNSKKPDGKFDFEDMCVRARMGDQIWNLAKYATNSQDYGDYINARDNSGNLIIPENEREFIENWMYIMRGVIPQIYHRTITQK